METNDLSFGSPIRVTDVGKPKTLRLGFQGLSALISPNREHHSSSSSSSSSNESPLDTKKKHSKSNSSSDDGSSDSNSSTDSESLVIKTVYPVVDVDQKLPRQS